MNKYTFEEINYIKDNYYTMSAKEIADYLNRLVSSVQDKYRKRQNRLQTKRFK